jgi:opacity protein-like surface antigen
MAKRFLAGLGLLAAGAASPLPATDTYLGLQVHGALPTGTLGDSAHLDRSAGFGFGFQVPVDFGAGQVIKPRLDYLAFRRDDGGVRYKADALALLLDYNHYLSGEREGLYLLAGLGLHHTRRDATRLFGPGKGTGDEGTTGFAYGLGAGYAFNTRLALEISYRGMSMGPLHYRPRGTDDKFQGNAVVASLSWTF